jgi:hypothetical protein
MNHDLLFSPFKPSPPSSAELDAEQKRVEQFNNTMMRIASENNLVKAKCYYRSMDSYFIQKNTRAVYKVNSHERALTPVFYRPSDDEIAYILQLNKA